MVRKDIRTIWIGRSFITSLQAEAVYNATDVLAMTLLDPAHGKGESHVSHM